MGSPRVFVRTNQDAIVTFPYRFAWRNNAKRAKLYNCRCRVLARGKMNSCLVEFENGAREIISRNALRKIKKEASCTNA